MWRLVVDVMNDLGMLMHLLSPLFPSVIVFIVCIGSLSISFTVVSSGAVRAVLTQHFALQSNAADISAKEGSQETVATMIAMASGSCPAKCMKDQLMGVFSVRDLVLGFDNIVLQADLYVDEGAIQELKSSERQPHNGKGACHSLSPIYKLKVNIKIIRGKRKGFRIFVGYRLET
nr:protein root UVB sensitive 3-like isoform X1 [Tanacetum cinerariifolium]